MLLNASGAHHFGHRAHDPGHPGQPTDADDAQHAQEGGVDHIVVRVLDLSAESKWGFEARVPGRP